MKTLVMPSLPPGFLPCHERYNVRYINGSVDEIPSSVGPNGGPVGYNKRGDKVEIVPGEDFGSDDEFAENILRRSDEDILAIYNLLWDRIRTAVHPPYGPVVDSVRPRTRLSGRGRMPGVRRNFPRRLGV